MYLAYHEHDYCIYTFESVYDIDIIKKKFLYHYSEYCYFIIQHNINHYLAKYNDYNGYWLVINENNIELAILCGLVYIEYEGDELLSIGHHNFLFEDTNETT